MTRIAVMGCVCARNDVSSRSSKARPFQTGTMIETSAGMTCIGRERRCYDGECHAMDRVAFIPLLAGAAEIVVPGNTVYILPMGHGLDQHIANRLTREHVVEVVADSARADALLTDRLGGPLE